MQDVMFIPIFMFILAISILVAYLILTNINTNFQALDADQMPSNAKSVVSEQKDSFVSLWDGIFAFLFIGLSMGAIIGAFLIDTHPIFMVLSIIMLVSFIIVGAVLANAYYEVESADSFLAFAEEFRAMHYMMNHLALYVLIEGILIMLALYTRSGL